MLEKLLKMCEGKEVQVRQDIHSGKPSYYTGKLRWGWAPFLTAYPWSVKDKNLVIGFLTEDVLDITLKACRLHNVHDSISILLRKPPR